MEDQLLGRVILTEKRELENERTEMMTDVTINNRRIKELEANLLHKLTTVTVNLALIFFFIKLTVLIFFTIIFCYIKGPLIEDVELMSVLNNTRATAIEVNEKLKIAKDTEIMINEAREEFRPVATRGSVLYFLICDMARVNNMYQTSLVQFLERFDISMERYLHQNMSIK